ncbi:MAG: tryptophan--tRNA ligase [Candidatus Moranbacteria bacterium CG10_big_fil_rev_8_21_14_0_10_35_21]|nr:MAG: tryptophan--tRNA ligase [Candidatus Moranbacteria bacterium CG10_big_fil_rev_8_21_14_0_10_35_21]
MNKRIFSGIQPSGNLHIGNYLGAIKNWVKLQNEYDSIFCVVDLHAITVPQDPEELRKRTLEVAKVYLASGIDPEKCSIFVQSHISQHSELTWILNTIAKVSELERMTQYKDKTKNKEGVGMGLFDYPVLMASDILLYDTELVPVGKDQVQHIELTRKLAERFNKRFGETFLIPKPYTTQASENIMGLDDPTKKMSKSAASEYNYISLTDTEEIVRKKIQKAVTDSGSEIVYSDDKPALKNLINIYSLFSDKSTDEIVAMYQGKNYSEFKTGLADIVVNFLKPLQKKMKDLSDEKVLAILKAGAEKVRPIAEKKMKEVKEKVGFLN